MQWHAHLAEGPSRFKGPLALIDGKMGDRIAEVPADPGQDPMPRANLIAAAPDLLAALEGLVNIATHPKATKEQIRTIAQEARAAIVKAKGQA